MIDIKRFYVFPNGKKPFGEFEQHVSKSFRLSAYCNESSTEVYPHNKDFCWNRDTFGPLIIPKKGTKILLTIKTHSLYHKMIEFFENEDIIMKNNLFYSDGKIIKQYIFKLDYYFMLGDNRAGSIDSRHFGFIPDKNIIGKVVLII